MYALIGAKKSQSQRFLENGMRIPVTLIDVKGNCIIAVKILDRDHYQAVQLGISAKKKASRAELGHAKGAKLEKAPKFLREVRIYDDSPLPEIGSIINPSEVFQPGDIVNVSGLSKGKGFA
ncbi:50S ribosomal protein L3, partial [Candidatus Curtissbacteria bacterium]|nr:50S ribosomal protein L3 [Candidatus Curtissbacteria bacterium]